MPNLPEWVKKHKTKGIYVNVRNGKYYLYKGHSERVPGKKYPKLVCDEYLGQVTEEDGLIASSPSVLKEIKVYEFGQPYLVYQLTYKHSEVARFYKQRESLIYTMAVLLTLELEVNQLNYENSWLCLKFPNLDLNQELQEKEKLTLKRMVTQMNSTLESYLGSDYKHVMQYCKTVYAVWVNRTYRMSQISKQLQQFMKKHKLVFELGVKHE